MEGKIGLFVNTFDDYQGSIVREAEAAAHEAGLAAEIFDSEYTAAKQAYNVMRFLHENSGPRLCALVLPESDANHEGDLADDPTLRLAQRLLCRGVGWITLNHGRQEIISFARDKFPGVPTALVAVDNREFGQVQGRQLRALLPKGGTALCVLGNAFDSACRNRCAGLKQEIEGSNITIEEVDGRWNAAVAETIVHKWISSPIRRKSPLHAVVGQNDHMALAARQALMRAADELGRPELKHIPALGGDGLPNHGRHWVDEKKLTATVRVTLPGRPAVEQLVRHWRDGAPLAPVTRLSVASYPPLSDLSPASAA
jgi:ABC-type sugar transport system substrate-binding protein